MQSGQTALMMAVQGGHLEIVKVLIEADADVNFRYHVCISFVVVQLFLLCE